MSDSYSPDTPAVHRAAARNGRNATRTAPGNLRARLRWAAVLPAAVMALLGAAALAWVLLASPAEPTREMIAVLAVAATAALIVLVVAGLQADRAAASSDHVINALRATALHSQVEVQRTLEQLQRGERPGLGPPPPAPVERGDPIAQLHDALYRAQHTAQVALVQASVLSPVTMPGAHVEVFVNLARRLQSLVHRTIQLLDELENQVEDPDLLMGLFQADHLVTRIRRHAENLAVLGGADSRRQWTTPQALTEVLRSAIAEVEHYSRVKLVPPLEGTLHGHAVADVVHLIAELVENATMFSPPHTLILMRVQTVTAGLVIEVEDRGLGMSRADQQRVNHLLADPQRIDLGALLRDGRLGLYVVSVIARRHGIAVQLQSNIFGGTQAVIVIPHALIGTRPEEREQVLRTTAQRQPTPDLAHRQPVAALATTQTAAASVSAPPARTTVEPEFTTAPSWPPGPTAPQSKVLMSTNNYPSHQDPPPDAADPAPPAPARPAGAEPGERPPLPRRTSGSNLVPQLQEPAATPLEEPAGEHDPQLMAAFREGYSQAETQTEEGGARNRPDPVS